ncbi:MAG: hypothetical protein JOZ43_08860 [Acidobacteriales bacterium]|nr:hypothetical protein [Terriglobales bacterium]
MFLDPDKLADVSPAGVLDAASRGHLGLDHRFLHALIDRPAEALPATLEFAKRDRDNDTIDLAPELIALFRHWNTAEAVPFLIAYIREDPEDVPDEAVEALVEIGQPALEPLLALYKDLGESESGEVAFVLANLRVRDPRILQLLLERLEYDLSDTILLLGMYGDQAAIPTLEKLASGLEASEADVKTDLLDLIQTLGDPKALSRSDGDERFDIWSLYPEKDDLPLELLDEDERRGLLRHAVASVRAAAAHSFFNRPLADEERNELLHAAQHDEDTTVRARAWEALINSTDESSVVNAMLAALRNPQTPLTERSGLLVGLAPEADRNEVRKAMAELYELPEARAKALEAMWRSMHSGFRDYFAKHLDDADVEVRRGAIWGVGYYGLKSEMDRLRGFFDNEDLRSDALFAYSLVLPSDLSRGRMKGLLARIEKDAQGLSEMEEELVKAALDERLMLAGKEPVFRQQED